MIQKIRRIPFLIPALFKFFQLRRRARNKIYRIRTKGTLAPSSRFLVVKMANKINFNEDVHLLQLGFGDGVFSREILSQMNKSSTLTIFEIDKKCRKYKINDPRVNYIEDSAENISDYYDPQSFNYILSTLPLASLPRSETESIFKQIKLHIMQNGKFLQYQYSLVSKSVIKNLFNQEPSIDFVLLNFPPAFIYETRNSQNSPVTEPVLCS